MHWTDALQHRHDGRHAEHDCTRVHPLRSQAAGACRQRQPSPDNLVGECDEPHARAATVGGEESVEQLDDEWFSFAERDAAISIW